MKRTKVLGIAVIVGMIFLAVVPVMAEPPGIAIGGVEGNMGQDMKNLSITTPGLTLDATKGTQWGDASGFVFGGPKDKVSLKMAEQQEVLHFQEQSSPSYSSAIGGQVEQNLEISGLLKRNGGFDLSAFSKEKTLVLLGRDGNAMESLIKSKTFEGIEGNISGTGKIDASLSTKKIESYWQETLNPDAYSFHYGQLKESVNLDGSLQVKGCDPSISGTAFTITTGKTETNSLVTPTSNSASANQNVRSVAGISGGKGITGEVDVKMVTGYEQSSKNPTSQINQSGVTTLKIDITKKPLR